jgi:hypothetical protein
LRITIIASDVFPAVLVTFIYCSAGQSGTFTPMGFVSRSIIGCCNCGLASRRRTVLRLPPETEGQTAYDTAIFHRSSLFQRSESGRRNEF